MKREEVLAAKVRNLQGELELAELRELTLAHRVKELEDDLLNICDHKFIDSDCCLKCGWKPTK